MKPMALRAYDVSQWGFFRFLGPDAKTFLQGLVTADVTKLAPGACLPSCVLTPKGLLAADFELYEESPISLLAVTRPEAAIGFLTAFEKKIMLSESKLKALRSEQAWIVIGEGFSEGLPWNRLNEPARLLLGVDPPAGVDLLSDADFQALRIASGFPWFGADMTAESLPLEARQERAISMDKGCYMGQETVSRIVFRGHVNKILMGVRFPQGAAPKPGGALTSVAGDVGLATVRYEDAVPGKEVMLGGEKGSLFVFESWPKQLSKG
jgi:tRNA-modifying protein YgfZ